MSLLNLILPIINQPDSTEDPKVNNALIAIQNWANGNVDFSNFAAGAGLLRAGTPHNLTMQAVVDNPTCGVTGTGLGGGTVPGITFATACVYAWAAGCQVYTNAGQSLAAGMANFSYYIAPSGVGVLRNFCNNSGGTLYPQLLIYALGY